MFAIQKVVPGIPHLLQKTESNLAKPLPRKSKNTLSVGKQVNGHDNSKTRHRRDFELFAFDPCCSKEELIRFWAQLEQPLLQKMQKTSIFIQNDKNQRLLGFL